MYPNVAEFVAKKEYVVSAYNAGIASPDLLKVAKRILEATEATDKGGAK